MEKIKPYLLPGLLIFYLVFSIGMIPTGYLINRAENARVAHFLFTADLVVLASQWLLATIWTAFGPGKFLRRLISCFVCLLLALLAFVQTRCLMFSANSWNLRGSLVNSWDKMTQESDGTAIGLFLVMWIVLVIMLCILRLIPGLRYRMANKIISEPRVFSPSRRISYIKLLLLFITAIGTLVMINTALFNNGALWQASFITELFLQGRLGYTVLLYPPLSIAIATLILMSITLTRFADWLFYRRIWLVLLVQAATIAAIVACCWQSAYSDDRRDTGMWVTIALLLVSLLTMLIFGLAGYRLSSRNQSETPETEIDPVPHPTPPKDNRLLSSLIPLEKLGVISFLALLVLTIPTGFRDKLVLEKWARHIHYTPSGEITGIAGSIGGTLHSLSFLKGNDQLTRLFLEEEYISEAGMQSLQELNRKLPHGLESLALYDCEFHAKDLKYLEGFASLRKLDLSSTPITDASMAHLRNLKDLQSLVLAGNAITDAGLSHLKELTNLRELNLNSTQITDASVKHLTELTQLQTLDVAHTTISPTGMAVLHKNFPGQIRDTLTSLLVLGDRPKLAKILIQRNQDGHIETLNLTGRTRYLTQRGTQGVLIMLKYAAQLPHLKALNLGDTYITDDYMHYFAEIPQLDYLDVSGGEITGRGLAELQMLSQLKTLTLDRTLITDADLLHLTGLTNLEILGVSDTEISDIGLAHLTRLTQLRTLSLGNTNVTETGLAHLQKLTNLRDISLAGLPITDAGLRQLASLNSLTFLDLTDTQLTDKGIAYLASIDNLKILSLDGTAITDAGLIHLSRLPNLQILGLTETNVTNAGVAKLEDALPDCIINH
jgi:internalin A